LRQKILIIKPALSSRNRLAGIESSALLSKRNKNDHQCFNLYILQALMLRCTLLSRISVISILNSKPNAYLIAFMNTKATDTSTAIPSRGKHKIAVCQITCKSSKSENFETCKQLIVDAHKQGAEMIFLPEACDYIESSVQASVAKGEKLDGDFINGYRELAAKLSLWISIGSFHRLVSCLKV
jgi:hypothetical protein